MKKKVNAVWGMTGLLGAAIALMDPALAQSNLQSKSAGTQATERPDPLDASAGVPQAIYRSPFAQYRTLPDAKPGSWIDANDQVGRIGGWRADARGAAAHDPPEGKAGAKPPQTQGDRAPQAAPGNMGGHGGHMQK